MCRSWEFSSEENSKEKTCPYKVYILAEEVDNKLSKLHGMFTLSAKEEI